MNSTLDDLTSLPLFGDFSPAALERLAGIVVRRFVPAGEVVFHEGDASTDLFFVVAGQVEFLFGGTGTRSSGAGADAGSMFGDMAFLDDSPRSATARAAADTQLLCLPKQALRAQSDRELELDLTRQIAKTIGVRLKAENANRVAQYERDRVARELQHQFGQFFVYVLGCAAIGMMVNHLLATQFPNVDVHNDVFTWSYLGLLLVPSALLVWSWKIPLDRVGVTLTGWRKSLSEGAVVSLGLCAATLGLVGFVRATSILPIHAPDVAILYKPEYLVHSYAQEFLARGLLQGSLQRFFDDGRGTKAVLMSSALFALLHIHFGFAAVALTFVSSVPLGLLYLRHQNLLGVTLVHWMLGVVAFLSGLL